MVSEKRLGVCIGCALVMLLGTGSATGCDAEREPRGVDSTLEAFPSRGGTQRSGWFSVAGIERELSYEEIEGWAVYQGDILLGPMDGLSPAELGEGNAPRSAVRPSRVWPHHVVPYAFHSGLSAQSRQDFIDATEHWAENTALRFVERTSEADYIIVAHSDGCSSAIGHVGGGQAVYLAPTCGVSAAIHEIGHAIGLWHEQARADRDDHITIHWNNIVSGKAHNFEKYTEHGDGEDVGPYDFASVMHYWSSAFARPGTDTITRHDGSPIGVNYVLSRGDIGGAKRLYGEPSSCDDEVELTGTGRGTCDVAVVDAGTLDFLSWRDDQDGGCVSYGSTLSVDGATFKLADAGKSGRPNVVRVEGNRIEFHAVWSDDEGGDDYDVLTTAIEVDGAALSGGANGPFCRVAGRVGALEFYGMSSEEDGDCDTHLGDIFFDAKCSG